MFTLSERGNVDINCDSFQKNACKLRRKISSSVFVFAQCKQALKPYSHLASMSTVSSAALTIRLITVRIRGSREDNIFNHVCQSVRGGGSPHVTTTYHDIGQSQDLFKFAHLGPPYYHIGTPAIYTAHTSIGWLVFD